ncbi:Hypothetical predicted protein [Pelobates cultripes]|uniref:Uncharacterized protein n=1 Tax=Pelobates cultripes TaxID=61616 RepID=A0AAD1R6K3_PELCU|nr:Hypothetical predicted protein [Pelobates cultripes]
MEASMVTKADLQTLTAPIQDTLRAELASIRTEVATQTLERSAEAQSTRVVATNTAVSRQGEKLLAMRRHLEDIANRCRRCNIQICGLPEAEEEANVEDTMSGLFRSILQDEAPQRFEFERAHRALRPRTTEDSPRPCYRKRNSWKARPQNLRTETI